MTTEPLWYSVLTFIAALVFGSSIYLLVLMAGMAMQG